MERELLDIVLLVGGAAIVPFIARRLKAPSSVIEIAYGIFLFNFVVHEKPEWFPFFKEIGLIYLMFIAGMELDLRELLKQARFYWYMVIVLLSFVIVPLVFVRMGHPFYLGITVTVMSAGIIIPMLKEQGLMRSEMGRDAIGLTLAGEFLSIVMLTGFDIYQKHGFTLSGAAGVLLVLGLLFSAVLFLKVLYLMAWWAPSEVKRVMESEDPVEEGIRAVIFIAFMGALMSVWAGVEPILGSFMAGTAFNYVFKSKGRFEDKVNAVGFGFFVPLFFMGVGADFDFNLFSSRARVEFAIFLSLMVYASNIFTFLFPLFFRTRWAEAAAMSLLLSAPLSMMIVAGTLGVRGGLLKPETFDSLVLASMISSLLYPLLFRPLVRFIKQER